MPTSILTLHPQTPELRKISKVVDALKDGAIILYPTDTGFTLGCALSNKEGIQRIRAIRRMPEGKAMTFLCPSLSNVSEFAKVSNTAYRTIKALIPGPFTFILPASKLVPKFAQDPKRRTSGIRVPENTLSQLLLKDLDAPLISISAKAPDGSIFADPEDTVRAFASQVDIAVRSDEYEFLGESTVIDMTTDEFVIAREGAGYSRVANLLGVEGEVE
jgi:tRNA threonylcarbamoyl adenosine modification protein (Sua5/YciO/YrdC/YwlC family)